MFSINQNNFVNTLLNKFQCSLETAGVLQSYIQPNPINDLSFVSLLDVTDNEVLECNTNSNEKMINKRSFSIEFMLLQKQIRNQYNGFITLLKTYPYIQPELAMEVDLARRAYNAETGDECTIEKWLLIMDDEECEPFVQKAILIDPVAFVKLNELALDEVYGLVNDEDDGQEITIEVQLKDKVDEAIEDLLKSKPNHISIIVPNQHYFI